MPNQDPNDQRGVVKNPNNPQYDQDQQNQQNQQNPNNPAHPDGGAGKDRDQGSRDER